MKKIIIVKDGPYHVVGNIPLDELIITSTRNGNVYKQGRNYVHGDDYYLCRCGKSKNMPFCDGSHIKTNFVGDCKATRKPFSEQTKKYYGENYVLEDNESLCAFARFCHNADGDVWNLTELAENETEEETAIKLACDCPAGRLVMYDKKSGEAIEPEFEPSISILKDPDRNCDGPIWVKGGIKIEDEDGEELEVRNRVTLCRCGESTNKPFCDATHINKTFLDD